MEIVLIDEQSAQLFDECIAVSMLGRAADPNTLTLGAVDSESRLPMGAMLAAFYEKSVYIDWLYILPEYRGRGAATALVGRIALMLSDSEEIEQLVAAFPSGGEGEALEEFFASLGFGVTHTEGRGYYFTLGQLAQAEFWQKPADGENIFSLEKMRGISLRKLNAKLRQAGASAVPLPIKRESFDPVLSAFSAHMETITTLVLSRRTAFGYELAFLYSDNAGSELKRLLNHVGRLAIEELPPDTMIFASAINNSAEALLKGLLPELKPITEVYAAVQIIHEKRSGL